MIIHGHTERKVFLLERNMFCINCIIYWIVTFKTGGLDNFNNLGQRFPNNLHLLLESAKVGVCATYLFTNVGAWCGFVVFCLGIPQSCFSHAIVIASGAVIVK